jgi:hypothetical protein
MSSLCILLCLWPKPTLPYIKQTCQIYLLFELSKFGFRSALAHLESELTSSCCHDLNNNCEKPVQDENLKWLQHSLLTIDNNVSIISNIHSEPTFYCWNDLKTSKMIEAFSIVNCCQCFQQSIQHWEFNSEWKLLMTETFSNINCCWWCWWHQIEFNQHFGEK